VYHGYDGLRQWFKDLHQEWETFETRVTRVDGRGDRASGVVIEGELYHLIEMRDGLILRLEAFRDRDAALDALEAT
jgi:ketosteroid isomerase-like protein